MPGGCWRLGTVATVVGLLLLRFLQRLLAALFSPLSSAHANASDIGPVHHSETIASVTSWTYTCRYLLPVLGGLLSCWLGHVRVLQLGGFVMLVTSGVMSAAVYLDSWRGDSPIALTACLLMPVFNGLVMPTAMQGVLSKRTEPRYRTVLCALIYASSALGNYAGNQFVHLERFLGHDGLHDYAMACIGIALVYCAIALPLSLPCVRAAAAADAYFDTDEDAGIADSAGVGRRRRILIRWNKIRRCFLIFAALIPFLVGAGDDRAAVFETALGMVPITNASSEPPIPAQVNGSAALDAGASVALILGVIAWNLALACCAVGLPRRSGDWRMPVRPRLLLGFCLAMGLELSLAVVSSTAIRLDNAATLRAIYITVSLVDSASAVLVMVGTYEVMDGFERDSARPLIVGIVLTVWGLSNVFGRLLSMACGRSELLYHAVLLALLLVSLLYTWVFSLPLSNLLTVTYQWDGAGHVGRQLQHLEESAEPLLGGPDEAEQSTNGTAAIN